ncbi:MAG: hypothetical protein WBE72_04485 [Terracidiphilus sp.]
MRDPTRQRVTQFIEAPAFSRHREEYLDDEGFRGLQESLARDPEVGDLIPGAGGIRKMRWKDQRRGKGKRGGLRVIYYCFISDEEIWLLTLYDKEEAADLTREEKERLRRALEAERAARKGKGRK